MLVTLESMNLILESLVVIMAMFVLMHSIPVTLRPFENLPLRFLHDTNFSIDKVSSEES